MGHDISSNSWRLASEVVVPQGRSCAFRHVTGLQGVDASVACAVDSNNKCVLRADLDSQVSSEIPFPRSMKESVIPYLALFHDGTIAILDLSNTLYIHRPERRDWQTHSMSCPYRLTCVHAGRDGELFMTGAMPTVSVLEEPEHTALLRLELPKVEPRVVATLKPALGVSAARLVGDGASTFFIGARYPYRAARLSSGHECRWLRRDEWDPSIQQKLRNRDAMVRIPVAVQDLAWDGQQQRLYCKTNAGTAEKPALADVYDEAGCFLGQEDLGTSRVESFCFAADGSLVVAKSEGRLESQRISICRFTRR